MWTMLPTLLAAAGTSAEGGALEQIGRQFGIDGPILLAQAINFGIVAFVLWRFAFKPVIETIDERNQKIADGLQYTEEMKQKLAETEKKQAETLREARQEAAKIMDEARTRAQEYEQQQRQEAAAQSEEILRKAREATELEREKMLKEVRGEIARLVVMTSGRVLQRELSEKERAEYNEAASKELASLN